MTDRFQGIRNGGSGYSEMTGGESKQPCSSEALIERALGLLQKRLQNLLLI